jgi:hypothetical protein
MRIIRQTGWASLATFFSAAVMAAGMSFVTAPAQAAFELPEGERITNLPAIPRAIPQKEAYELYDPKIGKNFDISKFWMRADLRVRPEMRNNICFGGGPSGTSGACNQPNANANPGKENQFYVQQMTRLGIGYDLSPDVNFYMELIDSRVWGANTGPAGDALSHTGSNITTNGNGGTLGVRAAYMLVRNFAGVQGLSVKAGRQYLSFGSQSLFGTFDWANTGFSHDGIMLQYNTKSFESYFGWFRETETNLAQGAATGGTATNVNGGVGGGANQDANLFLFYNQIKSVPGFLIEPYYFLYKNDLPSGFGVGPGQGLGTNKHVNQTRHAVGARVEMRKGNFDGQTENVYQFGAMGDNNQQGAVGATGNQKNLHINAWATRNWIGYTYYQSSWKPRLAFNFDYASGDGRANCTLGSGTGCSTANTFENMFPTNHIHMGYMDVQAWKNMLSPSANFQARPSKDDHIEIWYTNLNLANRQDNWYRGSQGVYIFSKNGNTKSHIGDEIDFAWTHLFMDGKLAFQAAYGHLFAGGYIAQNLGKSNDQDWAYAQLWMNF